MSDVDALKNSLEVANVVKKSTVEHLYDQFEKSQLLFLMVGQLQFAWNFIRGKQKSIFSLNVT